MVKGKIVPFDRVHHVNHDNMQSTDVFVSPLPCQLKLEGGLKGQAQSW